MLVFWIRAALGCESTVSIEPFGMPAAIAVWPEDNTYGPIDSIVVLWLAGGRALGPLVMREPDGDEIAHTRYDLHSKDGTSWVVLDPADAFQVGTITIEEQDSSDEQGDGAVIVVQSRNFLAPLGAPPMPTSRGIASEATWLQSDCPEEAVTWTTVSYDLCDLPALTLVAIGETEPPAPTLADPGDVWLFYGDYGLTLSEGLAPGASVTLWLGGFDGAGRFTGWTSDSLVMPPAGTISQERALGAVGGSCPDGLAWVLQSSGICEQWNWGGETCYAPDTGCGCGGGAAPGAHAMLALCLALRRCPHPGEKRKG